MKIEIATISTNFFLLITLLSVPLILLVSIGLAILTKTQGLVFLIVPLLMLTIYLGQKFSKRKTEIDLSETNEIKIDGYKIKYNNIIGYFINDTGLSQKALCLRLDTKRTIQITGSSVGKLGIKFNEMQETVIEMIKMRNPQIRELEYQDVYVQQTNILRPILYVAAGLVIVIDIIAFFLITTGSMKLPWQIFFVNFLLLGLMPYMKKRKNN